MSDEELFRELMLPTGSAAFSTLYERYGPRMYNYCVHFLSSRDDADDAFQEAWLAIHQKGIQGTVVHNVRSYLFKVAHNSCLMHLRHRRSNVVSIEDVEVPSLTSGHDKQVELQELLQLALSTLEPTYREAFLLHEVEGFSYDEMEQLTGDTINALRNKVWRARTQIRTILAPFVGEEL
jgi:RNA polymerase sigma-70 factor, ECF subfamily